MRMTRRLRWLLRLNGLIFVLLFLAVLITAGWLSQQYGWQWRWSGALHSSLSEPSRHLVERLEGPLRVVGFATPDSVVARHLETLLARYARHKPDLQVQMVNPEARPDLVRRLGVERQGELVLEYDGRQERVQVPTEARFSAALERLQRQGQTYIGYLTGHGERDLLGEANHDLGAFGQALSRRGYRLQGLNLARLPAIPDNLALLVIAAPQAALLPGERSILRRYVAEGGSLLWLTEPESAPGLAGLAEELGLRLLPGTVVDPSSRELLELDDPRLLVIGSYPNHPAAAKLQAPVLLPRAAALAPVQGQGESAWQLLLQTGPRQWLERSPGEPQRDAASGEVGGPLAVGLTRRGPVREGREQRVAVLGDGDFLSNTYLGNGANLALGLALVDWLVEAEALMGVYSQPAPDQQLNFSRPLQYGIAFGFLVVLPLGLLLGAAWRWWRGRSG